MPSPLRLAARVALAVLLAITLSPGITEAQVGGLINKAKKQAIPGTTTHDSSCTKPQFDAMVLELTPERIAAVMKGVQTTRTLAGPDGATAVAMLAKVDSVNAERDKLLKGKEAQIERYDDAVRKHADCRSAALDSIKQVHDGQMQGRMMAMLNSDPAAMQKMQTLAMDIQQKQAAGDTAGFRKSTAEFNKLVGVDPAADTAAANTVCGKPPVKPAWLARADSLGLVANKLTEDARALEGRAGAEGAKAAGMDANQFAVARERILAFLASDGKPAAIACYSVKEREALNAKMKDLKAMDFQ